jgi:hypothetical protein
MCDLLIPVEYQIGLHVDLYCQFPQHWQAQGYNSVSLLDHIHERQQRFIEYRARRRAVFENMNRVDAQMRRSLQLAEQALLDGPYDPRLDAQAKDMLSYLDSWKTITEWFNE